MKERQVAMLAVLAIASMVATAAVLRTGNASIASDRRNESVLPALSAKANDITSLVVRQDAAPFTIERHDASFVAADSGYPVKTDAVRDLIASSIELRFEEARTSDPTRYADLGLADPGTSSAGKEISFRTSGGELADLLIGNRDTTVGGPVGGVFVRLKGDPQTWLARGDVRLPASRSDWFAGLDLGIKHGEIKQIDLSGGGKDGVTATAGKPGEFTLANIPEKRTADSFKVGRLATMLESFAFTDVRKRTKAADDARQMVADLDGLHITVTSVGEPSQGWVQLSAQATNDAKRAQADAIAAKIDGYDFHLPPDRTELLGSTITDLTNEQKS